MQLLATASTHVRHALGVAYVSGSAGASYGISGTVVLTLIGTGVAVVTLVLLVLQNNRKTRREVASDMAREKRRGRRDGRKEKDAEWRSWLNFGLATGAIQLRPGTSTLPTVPGPDDDEGDDDDDE